MSKNKTLLLFFMLLIMLSLVVGGCNSSSHKSADSDKEKKVATSGSKESEEQETRIVKTIHGDIEIPTKAKRIVVDAYLPSLLLLGETPVGATDMDLENVYIKDLIDGIENTGDGSMERILALSPDLIIGTDPDKTTFESLSKIAPTVIIPYETYKGAHEEVRAFGEILGKEKEAEEWLTVFDKEIQQQRDRVAAVMEEGETVSILGAWDKGFYVYGDGIYRGGQAIYKQLQLAPPERVRTDLLDRGETYKQVSFEVFNDYAGDYIFFDESFGGKLDKEDSMWATIDAVKKDQVFYLDGKRFWPYDPIAVLAQAKEVADMLVDAKKNQ